MTNALERAELKRELIAVQIRLANILGIAERSKDAEEGADCASLVNLYTRLKHSLEDTLQLPFLQESVRQLRALPCLSPDWEKDPANATEERVRRMLAAKNRLEEAELKLAGAEGYIRDWNRLLPEWKEVYRDTAARVRARAAASRSDLEPELREHESKPSPEPEAPESQPSALLLSLKELFPKSERQYAFAQAIMALKNPDVGCAQVCEWLDDNPAVLLLPEMWMTDGNDRSFAAAWEQSRTAKRDITSTLDKVKRKLREKHYLRQVN